MTSFRVNTCITLLLFMPLLSVAQDEIKWDFTGRKVNADTFEIKITAILQEGWHTFSMTTPAGGPVPTSIAFKSNPSFQLVGKIKEVGKLEQVHVPIFGVDVRQYAGTVSFLQKVKKPGGAKASVCGTVEFMACNEEICMPSDKVEFKIDIQ